MNRSNATESAAQRFNQRLPQSPLWCLLRDRELNGYAALPSGARLTVSHAQSRRRVWEGVGGADAIDWPVGVLVDELATSAVRPDCDATYEQRRQRRHQLDHGNGERYLAVMERVGASRRLQRCGCGTRLTCSESALADPPDGHGRQAPPSRALQVDDAPLHAHAFSGTACMAYALAYHPAAEVLAVGTEHGHVQVVDVADATTAAAELDRHGHLSSPDIHAYIIASGLVTGWRTPGRNAAVFDVAWLAEESAPTSCVATAHASGTVQVVDVSSCSALGAKNRRRQWNRDWRYAHDLGTVPEAPSPPARIALLRGHQSAVRCVRPLPLSGGQVLATCGRDGNIFVYDLRSGVRYRPRARHAATAAMPRCDRELPFHIPVRSVQLGHFVSAPAQRIVARGRATRAQLLECAPDRAVAAVEWLGTDAHTLLSGGASDGLLKVWDLRATACQGAVLGDETPYARPTATRTLPMPLCTVRVRPGTSVASMHLHAPTGRLAVAAQRHGRPDAGTVAVLNAAHLGNTRRNHGIERQVHCPLWSHYARVRFDASGEYLAFGSGCNLCVIDWTSLPPPWDAPLEANADVDDAGLPQNRITSVHRSAEVTAVDWSRVHPCRVAAVADNEHVHITEWGIRGEEGEVEGHRAARHRLDGKPMRLWYHPRKLQRSARGGTGGIPCECCADERVVMEKVPQRASLCARCAAGLPRESPWR